MYNVNTYHTLTFLSALLGYDENGKSDAAVCSSFFFVNRPTRFVMKYYVKLYNYIKIGKYNIYIRMYVYIHVYMFIYVTSYIHTNYKL